MPHRAYIPCRACSRYASADHDPRRDETSRDALQQRGVREDPEVREEKGPLRLHAREEVGAGVRGETPMIFYHVTKMGREEDILCEGLRPDLMEARSYPKPHGRKAVFLWGSLRSARIAERSEAFNGTLDGKIFRVRLPRG